MKQTIRLLIAVFGLVTCSSFAVAEAQEDSSGAPTVGVDQSNSDQAAEPLRRTRAWCVGGPVGPSYAYSDSRVAQECAGRVASFSRACRRDVRQGSCDVFHRRDINAVNPGNCVCNGGGGYVGSW